MDAKYSLQRHLLMTLAAKGADGSGCLLAGIFLYASSQYSQAENHMQTTLSSPGTVPAVSVV